MTGLKRGMVELANYRGEWAREAKSAIAELWAALGGAAVDIQHIGSTAVPGLCAKPIVDIAAGVRRLEDLLPCREALEGRGFVFRGADVPGQILLVKGDMEKDLRTHHIHVVRWDGPAWHDYLDLRDYLTAFPQKAGEYAACKRELAARFPADRRRYTAGKRKTVEALLREARAWRGRAQPPGAEGRGALHPSKREVPGK